MAYGKCLYEFIFATDVKNMECGGHIRDQNGHSSSMERELNNDNMCAQVVTETNNVSFYEFDSSNTQT